MNTTSAAKADISSNEPKDKLWTLDFSWLDCIMTVLAACLFAMHISYALYMGRENVGSKNYFSGWWVIAIISFGVMIVRPSSNTTRIPAAIWVAVGLGALAFNFLFLR